MSKIHVLPQDIQNMIAAGEVIERPANVVKELMENSLDALADEVWVEIEGGGQVLIMVQDNGHGMSKEELGLSILRHATSKISSKNDLFFISSFGFRGEALPSIGAVSHLKLCSKREEADVGYCIEVVYGTLRDIVPCPLNRGTKVEVRDLFLKVPARLKFLKSASVEAKKCEEVFYKIALCHEDKEFSFKRDGKERFKFLKNEELKTRLERIWPKKVVEGLEFVEYKFSDYLLKGYVSDPHHVQPRGDRIIFFVNNRPVKDKLLLKALKQAYSGKLLSSEYPCAVLFIFIPPQDVDVNVHPAKTEVRFRDESSVFSLIYRGVKQALSPVSYPEKNSTFKPRSHEIRDISIGDIVSFENNKGQEVVPSYQIVEEEEDSGFSFLKNGYLYLGQLLDTYLILRQGKEKLIILDQHVLHERVLYERYKKDIKKTYQRFLVPIKVKIPGDRRSHVDSILKGLKNSGFSVKLEEDCIVIFAVPAFLTAKEAEGIVLEYVLMDVDEMDELLKLISCKKAIKANTPLQRREAEELIELWFECENKEFCPHGRPICIVLSKRELERMFKR